MSKAQIAYQAKQSILSYPHAKLTAVTEEMTTHQIRSSMLRGALNKLRETAGILNGMSICGPKLGFPYRVILLRNMASYQAYLNPNIMFKSDELLGMWESCTSIDGLCAWLPRPRRIGVEYTDEAGQPQRTELDGLSARLFLHELDHLNGESMLTSIPSRDFVVTSTSMEQKRYWDPNFPSREAFLTPQFHYYDFALSKVFKVPELAAEAEAYCRLTQQ
uniref:Peptide deformylase n=1 Tax=Paramoeba aestuarina TaxID=180227 RepID=A0A6U3D3M2_9EUKA|mmetsp:Transcript_4824/g.7203  ORF Transcript_4824/g.7203 Transcript_4824/m.7203 type:complete len:219 (+) Transcript_4824:43-699(+)